MIHLFVRNKLPLYHIYKSLRHKSLQRYYRHQMSHTCKHQKYMYQMSHCRQQHLPNICKHCSLHHNMIRSFVQRKLRPFRICKRLRYMFLQNCYKHLMSRTYILRSYKCQLFLYMQLQLMNTCIHCWQHHKRIQISDRHRLKQFHIYMNLNYTFPLSYYMHLNFRIYKLHSYKCQLFLYMLLQLMNTCIHYWQHHKRIQISAQHRLKQFHICMIQNYTFLLSYYMHLNFRIYKLLRCKYLSFHCMLSQLPNIYKYCSQNHNMNRTFDLHTLKPFHIYKFLRYKSLQNWYMLRQ